MASRGHVIKIDPEHEKEIFSNVVEISDDPVQIVLNMQIEESVNPANNVWEVTYLNETPNTPFGTRKQLEEGLIHQYQIDNSDNVISDEMCIEQSETPGNKWEELKAQRKLNSKKVSDSKARAWAGQKTKL